MSISTECESKFYISLTTEERRAELKPTAAASSGRRKKGRKRGEKKQDSLPQRMISLCNLELIPALKQGFSKV